MTAIWESNNTGYNSGTARIPENFEKTRGV
jgi:hypothetical protein